VLKTIAEDQRGTTRSVTRDLTFITDSSTSPWRLRGRRGKDWGSTHRPREGLFQRRCQ
jgi:hypothetical protein